MDSGRRPRFGGGLRAGSTGKDPGRQPARTGHPPIRGDRRRGDGPGRARAMRPGGSGAGPLTGEDGSLAAAGAGRAADYWTLTIALNPPGAGGAAPLPPVARGVQAPGVEGGERRELSPLLADGDRQETEDPERVAVSEALANFLWETGALGVVEET